MRASRASLHSELVRFSLLDCFMAGFNPSYAIVKLELENSYVDKELFKVC